MLPFVLVILLGVAGVVGDFFIKLAGSGQKNVELKWFVIGFVVYASTAFGWFYVMKYMKLSSLGAMYAIVTILLLVLVGVFYFHEKLNVYEIAGIIMAVGAVILLGRFA